MIRHKKRSVNSIFIFYFGLLLLSLSLLLTGYAFTFRPLNILLIIIVASYPIIKFIRSNLKTWVKLLVGVFFIASVILIGWNVPLILAFKDSKRRTIHEWNLESYKVTLNEMQGFAGGPYQRYELTRYRFFHLFSKMVAVGYAKNNSESYCIIKMSEDYYSTISLFEFDTCKLRLHKAALNGR